MPLDKDYVVEIWAFKQHPSHNFGKIMNVSCRYGLLRKISNCSSTMAPCSLPSEWIVIV
jgi:hypothetical protein